jgi:osmotically-inducible protein OsmY
VSASAPEIEQVLASAGIEVAIEESRDGLVLTGLISSEREREAAHDIVLSLAPDKRVIDNLEILEVLPENLSGMSLSEAAAGDFPAATSQLSDDEAIEPVDFTDQDILENPIHAAGPTDVDTDEDISEGEEAYVPPTDPPVTPDAEFLNGFQITAMDDDSTDVERSSDGSIGDEALIDAVKRELAEDASTTDLDVGVSVRNGVVRVRGRVPTLTDAENVLAVAERVPGAVEVIDALEVETV